MRHYYGRDDDGFKMALVSNFTDDDVTKFIANSQSAKLNMVKKEWQNLRDQFENLYIDKKENKEESKVDDDDEDLEMKDKYKSTEKITNALKFFMGDDWEHYQQNFKNEEVFDDDLKDLKDDDLEKLIPKIGPRSRIRHWLIKTQNNTKMK